MKPADIPASTDKDDQARGEATTGLRAGRAFSPQAWMFCSQHSVPSSRHDPSVSHPDRVYGSRSGKDHFPADRQATDEALAVVPHGRRIARANRAFPAHAVERTARSVRMSETGGV